jgi:hypothetical protein
MRKWYHGAAYACRVVDVLQSVSGLERCQTEFQLRVESRFTTDHIAQGAVGRVRRQTAAGEEAFTKAGQRQRRILLIVLVVCDRGPLCTKTHTKALILYWTRHRLREFGVCVGCVVWVRV